MGNPIIYIDESGFSQDIPRHHGGSRRGQRCYGRYNWQAKGRINVIGALLDNKLLHQAPAKAVFVMDNASFHKRQDIQEAIRNAGFTPEYLPAYSPDLNPIEHKRAQAKTLCKKRRCDVDTLFSSELF